MNPFKGLWYGLFVGYHLRKGNSYGSKRKLLYNYHYEKALHYYNKAYGKEYGE